MLRIIRFLIAVLVIVVGLAVHLRNDQPVAFDYYLATTELPLSLYLVMALCLGAILGILAAIPVILRLKREQARLRSRLRLSEKELENLRIIPVRQ